MAVMAREAWTDERLDDLNTKVDKGFDEVKGEIRDLRTEMNARFGAIEDRFNSIDGRFNSIEARLDGINRSIVIGNVTMTASIVGALLATQL
jgi:tetrahydromethanopterin S-methyltransferase subunit G